MSNINIAIVAVGYNRIRSMSNLLMSIAEAEYCGDTVDLIISLDKGENQKKIINLAEEFEWKYGKKIIKAYEERQGLRNHIIKCGNMTKSYSAVIILEDDLLVSKYYYVYTKKAIDFYKDADYISGISLYKHLLNPGVCRPFEPVNNGFDAYFIQFAQSWGQCWTQRMWEGFIEWYKDNEKLDVKFDEKIPEYITKWDSKSWLKYYIRYTIESNKFFVYPQVSLTTNSSDIGEHSILANNDYQVPLLEGMMNFRFPNYDEAIKYDVFFERLSIVNKIFQEIEGNKLLDLYAGRTYYGQADILISTKRLQFKIIKSIQLKYRPMEINCLKPTNGEGIYIYDLRDRRKNDFPNEDFVTRYDIKNIHWKKTLKHGLTGLFMALKIRIFKS